MSSISRRSFCLSTAGLLAVPHASWAVAPRFPKNLDHRSLTLKDDANGMLPFFIEWGSGALHPSADAPRGCRLAKLEIGAPDPAALQLLTDKLQLDVHISHAQSMVLTATIAGPKGSLALHSR